MAHAPLCLLRADASVAPCRAAPPDFFLCRGIPPAAGGGCGAEWTIADGLAAFVNLTSARDWPVKDACLPAAQRNRPCQYACRDADDALRQGTFIYKRLETPWAVRCGGRANVHCLCACAGVRRGRGGGQVVDRNSGGSPRMRAHPIVTRPPLPPTPQVQEHIRMWGAAITGMHVYSDLRPFFASMPQGVYRGPSERDPPTPLL